MLVHEIVSVRVGRRDPKTQAVATKIVELNAQDKGGEPGDGPRINSTIHIEDTKEALREMFGEEYDTGDRYTLAGISFEKVED